LRTIIKWIVWLSIQSEMKSEYILAIWEQMYGYSNHLSFGFHWYGQSSVQGLADLYRQFSCISCSTIRICPLILSIKNYDL